MKNTVISISRRRFVADAAALGMAAAVPRICAGAPLDDIARWQNDTEQVSPEVYRQYMIDGDTRGFASLEKLEKAFDKVLREMKATAVDDTPAVWSVYNMGYIVKTRESIFFDRPSSPPRFGTGFADGLRACHAQSQ